MTTNSHAQLSRAVDAAQFWGDEEAKQSALDLKKALSASSAAAQAEQWAINKGVHFNDWANLGKKDFQPVVDAFKELLELFDCKKCDGWFYLENKKHPGSIRCLCAKTILNLNKKED